MGNRWWIPHCSRPLVCWIWVIKQSSSEQESSYVLLKSRRWSKFSIIDIENTGFCWLSSYLSICSRTHRSLKGMLKWALDFALDVQGHKLRPKCSGLGGTHRDSWNCSSTLLVIDWSMWNVVLCRTYRLSCKRIALINSTRHSGGALLNQINRAVQISDRTS